MSNPKVYNSRRTTSSDIFPEISGDNDAGLSVMQFACYHVVPKFLIQFEVGIVEIADLASGLAVSPTLFTALNESFDVFSLSFFLLKKVRGR